MIVVPNNPEDQAMADTMTAMVNHVLSMSTEEFVEQVMGVELNPYQRAILKGLREDARERH